MSLLKSYIFISYASEDIEFVYHLTRLLEQEQFKIWMDKKRLVVGHDWWQEIEEGIINCDAFIIVMSPNSKESGWVKRELLLAEKEEKLIFPILFKGEIWSRLADKQYTDMSLNKQAKLEDSFIQYLKQQIGDDINNKNQIIDKEMAVINSKGIIGITENSSSNYTRVQSILNKNSSINARLKGNTSFFGTLKWNTENYNIVQLHDIPRQAPLKIGDTIETGGKSTIFPEGIPIGVISKINQGNTADNKVDVTLFNNMSNLGHVYIIKSLDKKEIRTLELIENE